MNLSILKAAVFAPTPKGWGLPLLFWGPPGVGKSEMLEDFGRLFSMHVQVLSPGEMGEGAFGVTPVPAKAEDGSVFITYPRADWTNRFEDSDDRGIVLVDEATTAPPAVQPALMGLIHNRRIGSHYLGRGIRILGAANPPEQAAAGYDLPLPVANRFGHLDWPVPSVSDWNEYEATTEAERTTVNAVSTAEAEEKRVLACWGTPFARAKGLIGAFLRTRPSLMHAMPSTSDPEASRAWPSHRTWSMAVRAMASADVQGLNEADADTFVGAFVGMRAMLELASFRRANDLPDPGALLDGQVGWKHDPGRLDRTFAVLSACTALVVPTDCPNRNDRVTALWKLLLEVASKDSDLVVPQIKPLGKARLSNNPAALPVLTKLRPTLDAAGIKMGDL